MSTTAGPYLRVESAVPNRHGRHPGAFALLRALRESDRLDDTDAVRAADLVRRSYALHVEPPGQHFATEPPALSWFVDDGGPDAVALISLMEDVAVLLQRHGVRTREVRCADPGTITYRDRHQVAAIPFTPADWPF